MIVKHRNFNKINISKDKKEITKESSQSLEGEIYYYQSIPKDVRHMFPNMREYSEDKRGTLWNTFKDTRLVNYL